MVKRYYIQDYPIILNILVAFWRAKNSLENNVSHFSINNTV